MTKNLETADILVKLILATTTISLFVAGVIAGPLALTLVVLSGITIALHFAKLFYKRR